VGRESALSALCQRKDRRIGWQTEWHKAELLVIGSTAYLTYHGCLNRTFPHSPGTVVHAAPQTKGPLSPPGAGWLCHCAAGGQTARFVPSIRPSRPLTTNIYWVIITFVFCSCGSEQGLELRPKYFRSEERTNTLVNGLLHCLKAQCSKKRDFLSFIHISRLWGWNNTVILGKWL
jgi:hypothetical protein